ncbi:HEAT repeat domain-containing protein [uncultured Cocleimonas sp.]|uniref:HEAT repeat domain-containing protein n=1 Tax=uncultured Cocleimonas sp. TaxID=1051587 RepID=UPI002614E52F|nr:hypothetical protein [uncultured Cocleimonas sp.]
MGIRQLVSFFTLQMLFFALIANADSGSTSLKVSDTNFLNKLRTTTVVEDRLDLLRVLEKKPSESTRLTLEIIALDTKEDESVRMQAICSLGDSATKESVPILLDILETDLIQRRGFWACVIPLLSNLNDRRVIPLLTRIANLNKDHLAGMDHMAIEALAEIGDEREVCLLNSKAYIVPVRLSIIKGLARIGSIQSVDILIGALQEEDEPEIIKTAEAGLLKLNEVAIPALNKALQEIAEGWNESYRSRIKSIIIQIQQ